MTELTLRVRILRNRAFQGALFILLAISVLSIPGYQAWHVYKMVGLLGIERKIATYYSPGGLLLNSLMIWLNLQPWQGTAFEIVAPALLFVGLGRRSSPKWAKFLKAIALIPICLAIGWWIWMSDTVPPKIAEGFPVATYTKTDDRGERTLVFIGESHVSNLAYYKAMDSKIGELTDAGYEFFYEEAPNFIGPCQLSADLDTYETAPKDFFIHTLRSPLIFPSAHWLRHWHMMDLPNSDVVPIARTVSGEACFVAVNNKRNEYILNQAEQSVYRRIALRYGSSHLFALRPILAEHGWTEQSLITLPDDRPGTADPNR